LLTNAEIRAVGSLNDLDGKRVLRALLRLGWFEHRVVGSHHVLKREGYMPLTVPVHRGKSIKQGTMRALLKQAGITEKQFLDAY